LVPEAKLKRVLKGNVDLLTAECAGYCVSEGVKSIEFLS
jgi:hypothetical protein